MKFMRNVLLLVLTAALVLSLAACAGKGNGTLSEEEDVKKLTGILDDIAANVHPGTAGSSLVSVRIAADLVSWAASSNMSKKEAAAVVSQWMKDLPEEQKQAFKDQMKQVAVSYGRIALDGAKDLLEAAGVNDTISELSGKLKDTVEAILASGGVD